jgi:diguanylate cyclase (GGDEF)-like protein
MIDVDYFKGINDKYGHVEGDHALRLVAEALKKTADANHGFAARLGGDEFLISTFNNSIQDPEKIKQDLDENLRSICENNHIPYQLIVSVGYAKCDSHQTKIINLFNEADQMLYEKKDKHHAMGR